VLSVSAFAVHKNKRPRQSPEPHVDRESPVLGSDFTPSLAPGKPAAERDSFGKVVLIERLREVIRWPNPALPEKAQAVIKRYLIAGFESRLNP